MAQQNDQAKLFAGLSLRSLARAMGASSDVPPTAQEAASTLFRFFRSRHVLDLKLIFWVALSIAIFCLGLVLIVVVGMCFSIAWIEKTLEPVAQIYALPLFAFCGVIIGWAYRSASTRLGVVDLFACEIATLCRVGTVFDIGTHYVELFEAANRDQSPDQTLPRSRLPHDPGSFVSQEQYFPVFDSNSRDLQLLEARVVNNIVEFYTYMKAMRDTMRLLANIEGAGHDASSPAIASGRMESPKQLAILNVIYMTFLAYEGARRSIHNLVEFEPTEAENTMVVLVTELTCFAFLLRHFGPDELQGKRLELRRKDYEDEVARVRRDMATYHKDPDWLPALRTIGELERRYVLLSQSKSRSASAGPALPSAVSS